MQFGFPRYGGGKTRTTEYKDAQVPAGLSLPPDFDRARALASAANVPLATALTDLITKSSTNIRSSKT